jgi:type VI secretion system secreted protein Hcp
MKLNRLLILIMMLSGLAATPRLQAAFDAFLKLDGIDGESTDAQHPREIVILSFSHGISNTPVAGGGGTGKASFSDLSLTKTIDKSSPQLFLHCAQGKHIPSAILTLRKAGGNGIEFYTITLTDVLISSVQNGGSSGGALPVETLSLNFTKIEWRYVPEDASGGTGTPVTTSWNLATNTP